MSYFARNPKARRAYYAVWRKVWEQRLATGAVEAQMAKLQAVVDVDWSASDRYFSYDEDAYVRYVENNDVEPFAHYFDRFDDTYVRNFINESERARLLRNAGFSRDDAIDSLRSDAVFMDSLRAEKTRLEGGRVVVDPATGAVRAWVGGKNFVEDKYDHVMQAQRQPGSTFKLVTLRSSSVNSARLLVKFSR